MQRNSVKQVSSKRVHQEKVDRARHNNVLLNRDINARHSVLVTDEDRHGFVGDGHLRLEGCLLRDLDLPQEDERVS